MTAIVNSSAGPFVVTSQNNAQTVLTPGQTETITWNVAGTTANGINTANVNILLSTDGGDTFDTVLASNVPNDGSHDIVVPDVTAAYCRIMVEAVGNIFFNVNDEFFAIGNYNYETVEVCNDYVLNGGITIPENATSYASFTFSIPDNVQITDLNIAVDITHNNNGSLFHAYRYPGFLGSGVDPLLSGQCEGSSVTSFVFDDDGAIFDCFSVSNGDVVQAQSLLANANGTSSGGDWTFYIVDTDVGDGVTGTWNSTTFTICSSEIQPVLSKTEIDPNALAIYPNPNNGEFTINFDAITDNVNINVYDIRGRLVFDNSYKAQGQFNQNINLGNVQAGLYILNVQDGNQTLTKKLIVK
jgi:subtilisin-like proprotein convertase family protein